MKSDGIDYFWGFWLFFLVKATIFLNFATSNEEVFTNTNCPT